MSDPLFQAMRELIRESVAHEVLKAETRLKELVTREAPKVIEGPAGKDGAPGKDGRDGVDGKPGIDGKDGAAGANGNDGAIGERGVDGLNGKDGSPSTVPGPAGPKGERGADGIATREELHSAIEERVGEIQVRTFADIYQGVYENGRVYTRGLLTTWGGSLWLSQAETRVKPGESPDWKLVVKKGADARK